MEKVALITGTTGQDGSYLVELLLSKGYTVHGLKRRASSFNQQRVEHIYNDPKFRGRFFLHYGDMVDLSKLTRLICEIKPKEIYNLAAQSHVKLPIYTAETDGVGVYNMLEAIRGAGLEKEARLYQASTSELYGKVQAIPQDEETPFYPRSPYAVSKLMGYWAVVNYREAYKMFAVNGILFNHESPRRGETFLTRKVTRAVARIKCGKLDVLELGNLDSKRDWGHALDYVEAMWMMLQHETPEDFVIATGKTTTVREFCEKAFAYVGVGLKWEGEGVDEVGKDAATDKVVVRVNPRYFRPTEVDILLGNPAKAERLLGWKPKHSLDDLVKDMMDHDMKEAQVESFPPLP